MATKRKVVDSEGRKMIASVYKFLKEEYQFCIAHQEPNSDYSHLRNITKRTAEATGVSVRTVERILKEKRSLPDGTTTFPDPMKKRKKRSNKVDIDAMTADVFRSTIHNYYILHNKMPTLKVLKSVLKEKANFTGCLETLRKILKKLGYKWRKTENNKKVMTAPKNSTKKKPDNPMWPQQNFMQPIDHNLKLA